MLDCLVGRSALAIAKKHHESDHSFSLFKKDREIAALYHESCEEAKNAQEQARTLSALAESRRKKR